MKSSILSQENTNVGEKERFVSILGGSALAFYALSHRSTASILLILGAGYLVFRGTTGICFLYRAMHIKRDGKNGDSGICVDVVELASEHSFPASDPPGWTGTIIG